VLFRSPSGVSLRAVVGDSRAARPSGRAAGENQRRRESLARDTRDEGGVPARGRRARADVAAAIRAHHPRRDRGLEESREGSQHQGGMSELKQRDYLVAKRGPLDGIRILDLSRLVAGNTLTGVLADFGAEVVKVEPEAGDTLRAWKTKDVATNWKLYARNKKSIALELRQPKARDILVKLVEKSDAFVESFR